MSSRWDSERRDRERNEEQARRAETERRGEELREAWRQHHPREEDHEKGRPKRGRRPS